MEFFLIYILVILDNISRTLTCMAWISAIAALIVPAVCLMWASDQQYTDRPVAYKKARSRTILAISVFLFIATLSALVPTTKQFAVIIGGGAVWQAVTSDKGKEVAGKIGGALESKLYQYLNEEPEKQENK